MDIKELRVGSHIFVDGRIEKVYKLNPKTITIKHKDSPIICIILSIDAQPIPITEELLQEMGFEHLWEKDTWYWRKDFDDDQYVIIVLYDGYVRVKTHIKGDCPYNIFRCEYLHELETFVYLTLHEELMKD